MLFRSSDPFFVFPAGSSSMPPMPLNVCDEDSITVVLSWKSNSENLLLSVISPAGSTLTRATPGLFSSSGATWVYFRLELPLNGEREGTWQIQVTRAAPGAELFAPPAEEPFFVTATAVGGPVMSPVLARARYYTGDLINPQVVLRYPEGYQVHDAKVTVEIESPMNGTGNILSTAGVGAAAAAGDEQLDARTSTLIQLEQERGGTLIATASTTYPLFDDGVRDGDDALEPDGIFGNPLPDILRHEGHYTFHARATYGHECIGTRETLWSTYVSVGIDPDRTKVEIVATTDAQGGRKRVTLRLIPQDRYGNSLGPGRGGELGVFGIFGSTPAAATRDRGDGSYEIDVLWDPAVAPQPGVVIAQPERPPVTVMPAGTPPTAKRYCPTWLCVLLALLLLVAVIVILVR